MADDGERIRIPMEVFDRAAYAPVKDDDDDDATATADRRPAVDANDEYQKFLRSVFGGETAKPRPEAKSEEEPLPGTLEELEAQGKIAPIRRFEEADGTYEERRVAASQEALADPPQPVASGPEAYLPVGGEAVDLETAAKLLGLDGPEEPDPDIDQWETNGGATVPDVQIASDKPAITTVNRDLFDALMEVFQSIEAIPVEGNKMTVEEFNAAMDRQGKARERVRELLRG